MFVVFFLVSPVSRFFPLACANISSYSILQYVSAGFFFFLMLTVTLKAYPETKGVPLEEMDIVFGEGIYRYLSHSNI